MSLSKFMEKQTSFNPLVIGATLFFVVLLVAMILIAPEQTQTLLNAAKSGIFANFSWFYVLAFSVFLGFLIILSISSLGNIKLGNDEEEPEFGFLSWLAMLFAAGMGVGLMFFGVAEPLTHYLPRAQQSINNKKPCCTPYSTGEFMRGRCMARLH